MTTPRSFFGGPVWWWHLFPRGGMVLGMARLRGSRRKLCHIPLGGIVEVHLAEPGLRMKTLDRCLGLDDDHTLCRFPFEGVAMKPSYLWCAASSSAGIFGSCLEAPSTWAWADSLASHSFTRVLIGSTRSPRFPQASSGSTIRSGGSWGPLRWKLGVSGETRSDSFLWQRVSFRVRSLGCFVAGCGFSRIPVYFSLICFVRGSPHHHVSVRLCCFYLYSGAEGFFGKALPTAAFQEFRSSLCMVDADAKNGGVLNMTYLCISPN